MATSPWVFLLCLFVEFPVLTPVIISLGCRRRCWWFGCRFLSLPSHAMPPSDLGLVYYFMFLVCFGWIPPLGTWLSLSFPCGWMCVLKAIDLRRHECSGPVCQHNSPRQVLATGFISESRPKWSPARRPHHGCKCLTKASVDRQKKDCVFPTEGGWQAWPDFWTWKNALPDERFWNVYAEAELFHSSADTRACFTCSDLKWLQRCM